MHTFDEFYSETIFQTVLSIKFQLFIATSVWVNFFTFGLWLGSPTVVIPQLRREANTTAVVSDEMESWLTHDYNNFDLNRISTASVVGYAGLPWAVIFPLCMRRYGRKFPFIFASACALTSFIVYCSSSTAIQILAAEIIEGVIFASNSTVSMLVITEYTSPRHRGLFLTLKAASMNIAICIANAIGTFFHWKKIPILGTVCAVYSFSAIFWPESPYWLASKGRFAECMASHRWLKGTGDEAEKELKDLIQAQIEYQESHTNQHVLLKSILFKRFFKYITNKKFYKPTLLSMLMVSVYFSSGKMVCIVYANQMIKKISNSETAAYVGMLILDVITIFAMYFGCFLSKILNRRTLLLNASILAALFLYALSFYLYLIKLSVIKENVIMSLILLVFFSVSVTCGPLIMCGSVYAELIPLRFKTLSIIITVLSAGIVHSTILKISPFIFKTCDMHGTFLFFGISFSICIYLFYAFLPETKDKTLQEIENCFKDNSEKGQELVVAQTLPWTYDKDIKAVGVGASDLLYESLTQNYNHE
ncbi:hypothetical protein MSG28_008033 [Choristoneura fumiferana]|uniref:Uncharacterized protein n=1 Tax=Choristoneura fumiferana TaxID=7141 RepID=A0ACC0J9M5_CHOFU|nr:hypothetical protein MSG28_008033 [Choristoneura fumiferana]